MGIFFLLLRSKPELTMRFRNFAIYVFIWSPLFHHHISRGREKEIMMFLMINRWMTTAVRFFAILYIAFRTNQYWNDDERDPSDIHHHHYLKEENLIIKHPNLLIILPLVWSLSSKAICSWWNVFRCGQISIIIIISFVLSLSQHRHYCDLLIS